MKKYLKGGIFGLLFAISCSALAIIGGGVLVHNHSSNTSGGATLTSTTLVNPVITGATLSGSTITASASVVTPLVDSGTIGVLSLRTNNGSTQFQARDNGATVDFLTVFGGSGVVSLIPSGANTNVSPDYYALGTGNFNFWTGATNTGGSRVEQFAILHTASSTRNITVTGSNGGNPTLSTTAGNLSIPIAIVPSSTLGIVGTVTNDSAQAGSIGEFISQTVAPNSISVTNVTGNITSISLTAGDWDCTGTVNFTFTATTNVTNLKGGISLVSATLPSQELTFDYETAAQVPTASSVASWVVPTQRILISTTTTVFLVANATVSVSTAVAGGFIRCRRMR